MVAVYPDLTLDDFKRELAGLVRAGLLEGEWIPEDPDDPGRSLPTAKAVEAGGRNSKLPNRQAN